MDPAEALLNQIWNEASRIPVGFLPFQVRLIICNLLDPKAPVRGRDYRWFGELVGLSTMEVQAISARSRGSSVTEAILREVDGKLSVWDLICILRRMEVGGVREILESWRVIQQMFYRHQDYLRSPRPGQQNMEDVCGCINCPPGGSTYRTPTHACNLGCPCQPCPDWTSCPPNQMADACGHSRPDCRCAERGYGGGSYNLQGDDSQGGQTAQDGLNRRQTYRRQERSVSNEDNYDPWSLQREAVPQTRPRLVVHEGRQGMGGSGRERMGLEGQKSGGSSRRDMAREDQGEGGRESGQDSLLSRVEQLGITETFLPPEDSICPTEGEDMSHQASTLPMAGFVSHQASKLPMAGFVSHQASTLPMAGFVSHQASTLPMAGFVSHQASTLPMAGFVSHQASTLPMAGFVSHQASTLPMAGFAQGDTSGNRTPEMAHILNQRPVQNSQHNRWHLHEQQRDGAQAFPEIQDRYDQTVRKMPYSTTEIQRQLHVQEPQVYASHPMQYAPAAARPLTQPCGIRASDLQHHTASHEGNPASVRMRDSGGRELKEKAKRNSDPTSESSYPEEQHQAAGGPTQPLEGATGTGNGQQTGCGRGNGSGALRRKSSDEIIYQRPSNDSELTSPESGLGKFVFITGGERRRRHKVESVIWQICKELHARGITVVADQPRGIVTMPSDPLATRHNMRHNVNEAICGYFQKATCVILAVSPGYRDYVDRLAQPASPTSHHVSARLIYTQMMNEYCDKNFSRNKRFYPVMLHDVGGRKEHIPDWLASTLTYTFPANQEELARHLREDLEIET